MGGNLSLQDKINRVRDYLLRVASAKPFKYVTYEQLAKSVEFEMSWSQILDPISESEKQKADITFLVVRKDTLYPAKIDGIVVKGNPTKEQMDRVKDEVDRIIKNYNPEARNYYS
jgi:hypothetical protein